MRKDLSSAPKKEVYAPHELARIFHVTLAEVEQWMKSSQLHSFRISGGHDRIAYESLCEFAKKQGVPLPDAWKEGAFKKFRVLIIEDDKDLLEIIAELLQDDDRLEIVMEENGYSGVLRVASLAPDVILLDFLMPGMTGFEVCRELKKNQETCDIPVMALTSLSRFEDKREIFKSGVSAYVGKPFQSEVLLKTVQELLGLGVIGSVEKGSELSA